MELIVDLRDYWHLLRRGWATILVAVIVCLGVGITFTALAQPTYESEAKVFVSNVEEDPTRAYKGGLFASLRVTSYADLVTSEELAKRVGEELDLDPDDVDSLADDVEAEVIAGTVIVQITATGSSPEEAQELAQAYADQLPVLIDELETTPGSDVAPLKATVVNDATLEEQPVGLAPLRNLVLSVALGLLFGAFILVARDLVNSRVRSARRTAETVGAPVLATLPRRRTAPRGETISGSPGADYTEAVRVLRTGVEFLDDEVGARVYLVTSPASSSSKSHLSADLALAFAEQDRKVLLVDGDLREPRVAEILGLAPDRGLTSLLTGDLLLDAALQRLDDSRLDVLASGPLPSNPSELSGSATMRELIEDVRKDYDVVIIDGPALLPLADAALLARVVDGTLLVAEHDATTTAALCSAADRLESVHVRAAGVVLTGVPTSKAGIDSHANRVRT